MSNRNIFKLKIISCCIFIIISYSGLIANDDVPEYVCLIHKDDTTKVQIVDAFAAFASPLYRDPSLPAFTVISNDKRVALGIGGNVRITASYDFYGMVDSKDFVPFLIPVPRKGSQKDAFKMDAATSKIFLRLLAQTNKGIINLFIDTDFRGEHNRYRFASAYINFNGFTAGRHWSIISDLNTFPPSVDWQGPNVFFGTYTNFVAYEGTAGKHFQYGVALELPQYTFADSLSIYNTAQSYPSIPFYIGVRGNWGHIRAAGLARALKYKGVLNGKDETLFTWGTVLSSRLKPTDNFSIFLQGCYGRGVSEYVFDLSGNGMDVIKKGEDSNKLAGLPLFGFLGGIKYNFSEKLEFSSTYSQMRVYKTGEWQDDLYRLGQYVAATVYYNFTGNLQGAVEYNYGRYEWQNQMKGSANRLQTMIRYNF